MLLLRVGFFMFSWAKIYVFLHCSIHTKKLLRMNLSKILEVSWEVFFRASNLVLIWYMYCGVLFCHSLLNISLLVPKELLLHAFVVGGRVTTRRLSTLLPLYVQGTTLLLRPRQVGTMVCQIYHDIRFPPLENFLRGA